MKFVQKSIPLEVEKRLKEGMKVGKFGDLEFILSNPEINPSSRYSALLIWAIVNGNNDLLEALKRRPSIS